MCLAPPCLTCESLWQALAFCIPRSSLGRRRRGWLLCFLLGGKEATYHHGSSKHGTSKWKRRRHKSSLPVKVTKQIEKMAATAVAYLDNKAATWVFRDRPAKNKERRLTWTRPRFRVQKRVRGGMSSGQNFNKRKLGTSKWFRTAATVCLIASNCLSDRQYCSTNAANKAFWIRLRYYPRGYCALRCITNSLQDFVKLPQKVTEERRAWAGIR